MVSVLLGFWVSCLFGFLFPAVETESRLRSSHCAAMYAISAVLVRIHLTKLEGSSSGHYGRCGDYRERF